MLFEFQSIGTHWIVNIVDELSHGQLEKIESEILKITSEFEHLYSRFIEDSLVSKLNRGEKLESIPEDLSNMLNLCEKVKQVTQGHFDINVGSTLEKLGYDSKYSFSENIVPSNRIDLGGIGKGYLIDKVKNYLKNTKIKYFFINAGGDIFATSDTGKPFEFLLEDPFDNTQAIGSIKVLNSSIAASSPVLRKWTTTNTNKEVHHLIDFKTGESVKDVAGVFTSANNAVNADLASTALFVGPKDLHKPIQDLLRCEYLIVYKDSSFVKSDNYQGILN